MEDMDKLIDLLEKDVKVNALLYKKAVNGPTPIVDRILENPDKIGTLSNLMKSGEVQKGFKVLRDAKQLDKTFEALIVKFKPLFSKDVIEAAQFRLDNAWKLG